MISANEYLIGITDGIPVWVLGLGSIALCIGLRYKHSRTITFASILMMAPSIIANVLPQARDPFFPSSNLFPVLFVLGTAPLFMLAAFFQKGIRQHQTPAIIGLLVVSIGSGQLIQHQSISTLPTITEWNAFQDMQTVLDSIPSDESVISTFETAAVLFQSNHKWEQWPSPFEEREAEWILVSSLDDQVWTGSIPPSLEPASLWYWTSTEDQWMLLFKRNATPPSPVLQDPCSALEHTHDHEALLQTSLAKECLLQQGSKLSASQWDNIASLACHPSFITAKTETSPMCIQQDDRLAAIHSQLCQDTPLNCIDNTLRQESQHQLYEQLLSSLLHDQQSAGVTLELGCENHTIAKSLAMALHKSEPALAMYLATCSGDEALYQLYLNERLEQNGIAACSGLFSILQKGTLSSQDRIRILAHDDSLTGIVARHILNTITTD